MTQEQISPVHNERNPLSKEVNIVPDGPSLIVNDQIGLRFNDASHLAIICDKTIPIERGDMRKPPPKHLTPGIGVLVISMYKGHTVYLGNEKEIEIQRLSSAVSMPVLRIASTAGELNIRYGTSNLSELKRQLAQKLKP